MSLRRRLMLLVMLGTLASTLVGPVGAADEYAVKRGALERQGRAWVERSEFSAPVREGARLVFRADAGSVVVKTGPSDRLECHAVMSVYKSNETEARRYLAGYELTARPLEGGGVYVNSRGPGEDEGSRSLGAEFEITVPSQFNLDLETQGGDLDLESPLQGELRATTAGGDIRTLDVRGPLRAETAGGDIRLGNIGQRVDARTAGGSIQVGNVAGEATLETSGGDIAAGRVEGAVHAETAGGDVTIESAAGPVTTQTAGGQIRLGPSTGSVRAETAGGGIWCQGARGHVQVETAGGSIDLFDVQGAVRASTAAGRILAQIGSTRKGLGASELESSMGDVQVYLPAEVALTIDAAIEMAAGHQIVSDFPQLVIQGTDEDDPEREIHCRGELNGGGEVLRLRTVNGNIEIRKLDPKTLDQLRRRQDAEWRHRSAHQSEKEQRRRKHESPPDEEE